MNNPFADGFALWVKPTWREAVERNGWGLSTGCRDQLLELLPGESVLDRAGATWERVV
jgi:hypothetical protein